MNRSVYIYAVVVWLAIAAQAGASEGLSRQSVQTPAADRTSSYEGRAGAIAASAKTGRAFKATQTQQKPLRSATVQHAPRFSDFYIYSASSSLTQDHDEDGYHSEFKVRFDADVVSGDAHVYAKLYLRRAGEDEWFLYHETDDFLISGQSDDDDYFVTTALDQGYATAEYDVLIDLYESGVSGVVATLGPADNGALSYLPLEEAGLDLAPAILGYGIAHVTTQLLDDVDGDGYYSAFRVAFDPDADFERRLAYAHVWVRPRGGDWIDEYSTEDFWVDTQGADDTYELDVAWHTGYPTSLYDVQIDLHDSATGELLASAGSDRAALAQIPLEDQSRDQRVSSATPGSGGNTSSREGGGGAIGSATIATLMLLMLARMSHRRRSATDQPQVRP
ncbi:MAG: choice-of-anchor H family protein [Povalibacter sp.]